ncbi:hypothetical protein N8860_04115 [Alphaproteobacteria bacterium]|nr:hypothetical protein [Alphaproteobacteria bacterium]
MEALLATSHSLSDYSILEHQFRFAGWCAATAASSSPVCRFKVQTGLEILRLSGVSDQFIDWSDIPYSEAEFDELHRKTCRKIIKITELPNIKFSGGEAKFTYGIAAKLLNCYLKPIYLVNADRSFSDKTVEKKKAIIHPPIDRVLLKNCKRQERDAFRSVKRIAWSTFSETEYFDVIKSLRAFLGDKPFWKIEYFWDGHQ